MIEHSVYLIRCECNAALTPHDRESVCPNCKRELVIEWGKDPAVVWDGEKSK